MPQVLYLRVLRTKVIDQISHKPLGYARVYNSP